MRAPTGLVAQHNAMATPSFLFQLVIAAVAVSSFVESASQSSSNGSCFPAERAALLSFKAGITSDPDDLLASWRQGHRDCCRWSGVTCSSQTGHVIKVDLPNRSPTEDELGGIEDPEVHSLHGQVSSSLLALRGSLMHLDLSMNTVLGEAKPMPGFLGSLHELMYLNLSHTGFVGRVPPQLGNLSKLVQLDIKGRIPSGHQLDILNAEDPASMYIGNPGLCGHPIPRQCSDAPGGSPANGDSARWPRNSLSQMDFLLGLIIGILAGAWMIFCGLLFMKKWRYAYFGLLDRLFDRLYVISIVTWRKWFSNTRVN